MSLHRCSMGFKSGLELSTQEHSETYFEATPMMPWLALVCCMLKDAIVSSCVHLKQVFKNLSVLGCIHPFLNSDQSCHHCHYEVPSENDAPITILHCRGGISQLMSSTWFSPDVPLEVQRTVQFFVTSHQKIFSSYSESLKCSLYAFYSGVASI